MTPVAQRLVPRRGWAFVALLCLLLILFGTLSPGEPHPEQTFPWDKLQHFSAFVLLALMTRLSGISSLIILPALLLLGVGIECLQLLIPYRGAEVLDALADFLGILAGLGCHLGGRLMARLSRL
ncbi:MULTISPECIES: VanZ family protein [Cobetia]|uniref:VanZ family protein n=1 Tax=Cobetia crustatorum TaxID=553385 RepID=A0A558HSD7_9GAMM|nr:MULTISPECIES: VanZ family protein [Cobetia]TVU72001.1 VanZ family protein [Cobetia crustatorum]